MAKNKLIRVNLSEDEYNEIASYADNIGKTKSEVIREAVYSMPEMINSKTISRIKTYPHVKIDDVTIDDKHYGKRSDYMYCFVEDYVHKNAKLYSAYCGLSISQTILKILYANGPLRIDSDKKIKPKDEKDTVLTTVPVNRRDYCAFRKYCYQNGLSVAGAIRSYIENVININEGE